MTNPASQLSPPTLHWGTTGPEGDRCDLCAAPIKPNADCFISIRRAFELHQSRMVETAPLKVLMCVACGWSRPYAPMPRAACTSTEAPNGLETTFPAQDGASSEVAPDYFDAGVMGDPRDWPSHPVTHGNLRYCYLCAITEDSRI